MKDNSLPFPCSNWAEKLVGLHPDSLSPSERKILDSHVKTCLACRAVFEDYRKMDERISRVLDVEPSLNFTPQLPEGARASVYAFPSRAVKHSIRNILSGLAVEPFSQRITAGKRRILFLALALAMVLAILILPTLPTVLQGQLASPHAQAASLLLRVTSQKPREESAWVHTVAWSPDGRDIASLWSDNIMQVWDAHTGDEIFSTEVGWGAGIAWSPDGKLLASIGTDDMIQILDVGICRAHPANCPAILTYKGHIAPVEAIAWSPDGTKIASASDDKTVQVWNAHAKKTLDKSLYTYRDGTSNGKFTTVAWSPDGQRIVSGDENGHVQIWDALTGEHPLSYPSQLDDPITSVSWSPDGKYIASAGYKGIVHVWDATTGQTISLISSSSSDPATSSQNGPIYAVAWSPNSKYLALASYDTVQVRVATTGELIAAYHPPPDSSSAERNNGLFTVAWSPKGQDQQIVFGGQGAILTLKLGS